MSVKNLLNVNSSLDVSKKISECGNYFYISAHGITVKVTKKDWIDRTISATIAQ